MKFAYPQYARYSFTPFWCSPGENVRTPETTEGWQFVSVKLIDATIGRTGNKFNHKNRNKKNELYCMHTVFPIFLFVGGHFVKVWIIYFVSTSLNYESCGFKIRVSNVIKCSPRFNSECRICIWNLKYKSMKIQSTFSFCFFFLFLKLISYLLFFCFIFAYLEELEFELRK